MMEWQCDTVRWNVQVESLESNLETECAERAQDAQEQKEALAKQEKEVQGRIAKAMETRRANLMAISADYTLQLQEAESIALDLRTHIREGKFDIRALDAKIVQLEQDHASLASLSSSELPESS